ncbi:MAG TPA: LysR family transcriptional regulator [Xanthobacteraceae bacterium]
MRGSHFAGLSAFVAVAEQGSFTRAARQLGLSTATLSQTVRGLEERLGIRLLNQTTRNVAPTDAGERLLRQLRPLLDRFDSAVELVNALRDKPAGHLRLTVTPPVARLVLPAVLARFLTQYPEISIEISVSSALTDIVAGRFDAGVRRGRTIARDMIAVRITNDMRPVVIASPDYLARHGTPRTIDDLHAHNSIRLRLPDGRLWPWEFVVKGKVVELEVEGSVVVNDPDLMVSAALEGIGVTYILEEYVAPMIADGRLVSLLGDSVLPSTDGYFLFYPSRRQNPAALKVLIEFLRTNLQSRKSAR